MAEKKQKPMNIYQKLVEVRKNVEYVQKSSKGFNFKYADDTSILSLIRPAMDEHGLILEFEMEKPELINEKATQVGFVFTWINAENPEERIEKKIYLQTNVADPQKMGSLMTYANRYFLYRYFSVPTAEMDLDKYQQETTGRISVDQLAYIEKEINGNVELRERMLNWAQAADFGELKAHQFSAIKRSIEQYKKEDKNGK